MSRTIFRDTHECCAALAGFAERIRSVFIVLNTSDPRAARADHYYCSCADPPPLSAHCTNPWVLIPAFAKYSLVGW